MGGTAVAYSFTANWKLSKPIVHVVDRFIFGYTLLPATVNANEWRAGIGINLSRLFRKANDVELDD